MQCPKGTAHRALLPGPLEQQCGQLDAAQMLPCGDADLLPSEERPGAKKFSVVMASGWFQMMCMTAQYLGDRYSYLDIFGCFSDIIVLA